MSFKDLRCPELLILVRGNGRGIAKSRKVSNSNILVKRILFDRLRQRSSTALVAGLFAVGAAIAPMVPGQTEPPSPPGDNVEFIDRIHQGDVIEIRVAGSLEYNWRGSLNPEGFLDGYDRITAPLYAQCKTVQDLGQQLDKALSETLRDPKVEIRIIDRSKRPLATIDGAVRNPQRMQLRRPAALSEIVVSAGGFTDRASGQIIISRPVGASCLGDPGSTRSARLDIALTDVLSGKPGSNPVIVSGDLIVVLEASPVFLLGAVKSQGRIDYRADLTVSRAVDSSGGSGKDADLNKVKIFRRDGGSKMIPVDLEKIRDNEDEDVVLRPFDIIDVPFKGKPPRRLPPVIPDDLGEADRRARLPTKIIE